MEDRNSTYSHDELYTYKEAAAIVGIVEDSIVGWCRLGWLRKVKLPNDNHKYVLRSEADALRGYGAVKNTREGKERIAAFLKARDIRDYVQEEHDYGDPIQWYSDPVHAEKAVRNNPSMFLDILSRFLGGKIQITHDGTGAH